MSYNVLESLPTLLEDKDSNLSRLIPVVAVASICYLALVRYLRYRYINSLRRKYPDPTIALNDPAVAEEVFDLTIRKEFPLMARQSLELALFKTYTVPSMSKVVNATGEFSKRAGKRTEDTELLLFEVIEVYPHIQSELRENSHLNDDGIAQQRARREHALRRIREIHSRYHILNGDYLYTLSMFIVEPIRWIDRYEWRKLDPIEKNALFRVTCDMGLGMGIKDIPDTLEKMFEFHVNYGRDHVRYADTNWKVGLPTFEHLLTRFPKFMRPFLYKALPSLLDPMDVAGFGLQEASPWMTHLINTILYLRAFFIRHFMLPRFSSHVRTPTHPDKKTGLYKPLYDLYEPTYPNGYCIHELGPEKFKPAKCPIPHFS